MAEAPGGTVCVAAAPASRLAGCRLHTAPLADAGGCAAEAAIVCCGHAWQPRARLTIGKGDQLCWRCRHSQAHHPDPAGTACRGAAQLPGSFLCHLATLCPP
jgi:hypothetical protein